MILDKCRISAYLTKEEVECLLDLYSSNEDFKASSVNHIPKYEWKLNNLRINVLGSRMTIDGSIATFLNGDSITDMDETSLSCLSESLSDALGIDSTRLEIKSLELTYNAFMTDTPRSYYRYFGEYPRKKKVVEDNGLYYRQQRKTSTDSYKLIIYDKVAEMRKKGKLPTEYKDSNILRFEIALKKEITKQLGFSLSIGSLSENWKRLVEYLKSEIMKIELKKDSIKLGWIQTASDIELGLIMKMIQNGVIDSFLSDLKSESSVNSKNLTYFKTKVRKARKLLDEAAKTSGKDCKLEELRWKIEHLH